MAFESRKLSPAETRYTTTEQELLGISACNDHLALLFGRSAQEQSYLGH